MFRLLSILGLISFGLNAMGAHTAWLAHRRIQKLSVNGRMIPPGSECERLLINAEVRFGKPLPTKVIETMIQSILNETGEKLIEKVSPVAPSFTTPTDYAPGGFGFFCFTAAMRVAVPDGGLIEIAKLKAGDAVLSYDFTTGLAVVNHIQEAIVTPDQSFGILDSGSRPIEVTERERFYARPSATGLWDWLPIVDLTGTDHLAFAEPQENRECVLNPVAKGEFLNHVGRATVYNLEMIGEPRNFFVEGFLVHNPHK